MIADIALAAPPIIIMSLGLLLMYRVLGELDLSIDATFTAGAAMVALVVIGGLSPWLGLLAAMGLGALVSLAVFTIHRVGRTQYLLASLIVFTGMYTINLQILGGASVGLIRQPSIFDLLPWRGDWPRVAVLAGIVILVLVLLYSFLRTSFGLATRAAGNNPVMARANRIDTRTTLLVGALISGALVGLGGALQVEIQGYADITMGIGSVIICVAALFLGELFFPNTGRVGSALASVVLGGILYTAILTAALRSGMPPTFLRLTTAGILVVAVLLARSGATNALRAGIRAAFEKLSHRSSAPVAVARPHQDPAE